MQSASSNSKGFTLFELLLVVLLIGIIYGIFVHKLSQKDTQKEADRISLKTLKSFLQTFSPSDEAVLRCFTPCETCYVYRDGKQIGDLEVPLFESIPNVYNHDTFGQLQRVEFIPIEGKNRAIIDVCFEYTLFANQSSSNYIVEYKENYYLFEPYIKPVTVFESLSEAAALFDTSTLLPTERRSYNF